MVTVQRARHLPRPKSSSNSTEKEGEELYFKCPRYGGTRLFLRQESLLQVQAGRPVVLKPLSWLLAGGRFLEEGLLDTEAETL